MKIYRVTLYKKLNEYGERYWEGENKFTCIIQCEDKESAALKAYAFYTEEFNPDECVKADVEPMEFENGILTRNYLYCEDTFEVGA